MPLEVHTDARAVAMRGAELFLESVHAAVHARGRCGIVLSGGSTPRATYEEIARRAGNDRALWAGAQVFWGDERCVPADDERSNERMARESLLARVPIPARHVFPMRCMGDAEAAARRYEDLIREHLGAMPRFDLVFLGLGDDGHTASLFPGNALLEETERWVGVTRRSSESFTRITLTLAVINLAARVIFLVSGAGKAEALQRALAGDLRAPASLVQPANGDLYWLVDAAAARRLGESG
ncbi:MAG: 6-phosphogluconolactonase [Polyangiaceae bacterium]|nr:6-phosphogluconolactonase [Polyangiaceae bacterium]